MRGHYARDYVKMSDFEYGIDDTPLRNAMSNPTGLHKQGDKMQRRFQK